MLFDTPLPDFAFAHRDVGSRHDAGQIDVVHKVRAIHRLPSARFDLRPIGRSHVRLLVTSPTKNPMATDTLKLPVALVTPFKFTLYAPRVLDSDRVTVTSVPEKVAPTLPMGRRPWLWRSQCPWP